jgi:DNA-binding transcriptional LysR family regulator
MKNLKTTLPGLLSAVQAHESGSFTAASVVLGLTPAAISKNVAGLEAALHVRLFNRTTRKLSLTEEGKAFIAQARVGLDALEAAATAATSGLKPQGLVRVNSPVGFGRSFVLPALPDFYAQHPDVQIELSLDDHAVDLVGQGFDVGIRGGSQPPEGMVARKICDVPAVLVATPQYLAKHGTPLTPADLKDHALLRVKFASGRMTPWEFKVKSKSKDKGKGKGATKTAVVAFDGPAKLLISDPEVILHATLLHMGIARLGRHHAHAFLQRGELVEVLKNVHAPSVVSMSIFYPHRVGLAPRVRVLVDFLLARFANDAALQGQRATKARP